MDEPRKIATLLRLLEDDSPRVRAAVLRELESQGPLLERRIREHDLPLGGIQRDLLEPLFAANARRWLLAEWRAWLEGTDGHDLERALDLLSRFQNGLGRTEDLAPLLDALAAEYLSDVKRPELASLVAFLFREKGLQGEREDYYHPRNSNLIQAIRRRRGIPITLACVLILVGRRVGIPVDGCSFPGHFLASGCDPVAGRVWIDCYEGGRLLDEDEMRFLTEELSPSARAEVFRAATTDEIVLRVLRNFATAYGAQGGQDEAELMAELIHATERAPA